MPYKDLGMYNMMSSEGPGFGSAADLGIVKPQTFSGSAPGTGGVLGVTNDLPGGGSGLDSSLKDIISKITGFGSSNTGGRRLEALTSLAGNMFGMQKQRMGQAASMEEKRLGEAGATERTNVGFGIDREKLGVEKDKFGLAKSISERTLPMQTLEDLIKKARESGGSGLGAKSTLDKYRDSILGM
jgi:hypothetical protein